MTRIEDNNITGVVLAGGLSRRMGKDKALLSLDGAENFMERAARILQELLPKVLIIGRQQQEAPLIKPLQQENLILPETLIIGRRQQEAKTCSGLEYLADEKTGCGPAGGIATALRHSHSACLVISCDMPFMNTSTLERLIAAWQLRQSKTLLYAYQQKESGKVENLAAIYSFGALKRLDAAIAQRLLKIGLILPQELQQHIAYTQNEALPFLNVNYPADLEWSKEHAILQHSSGKSE